MSPTARVAAGAGLHPHEERHLWHTSRRRQSPHADASSKKGTT
ncbi:Hypothetical protein SCLAV_2140 [Streptomyces clavuligerus]|uniref:Uncharacterized protein n=1 Tax=Streptomyces clavuligerus TaxID=1901 RepID=E2Q689_STRCL|nr:Hypothetical protein SCLAV_2140 [Streptomyces clavuligerus]